jgi:hypothetical protein
MIYTIGDSSEDSELSQLFQIHLGRRITQNQESKLEREIPIGEYIFYFPYHIKHVQEYKDYLKLVKYWATKYSWSTTVIIRLLAEPWRMPSGWYNRNGKKITRDEWEAIKEWEMI